MALFGQQMDPNDYFRKFNWGFAGTTFLGDPLVGLTTLGLNEGAHALLGGPVDNRPSIGEMQDLQTAMLLREQYDDWKKTFMPLEIQAINSTSLMNPGVLPNALRDVKSETQGIYKTMGGVVERQNRALGIAPSAQQAKTTKRLLDLGESASVASTQNKTRTAQRTMDEMTIMGSTPNPRMGG